MKNPPRWAKLSTPGIYPRPNPMRKSTARNISLRTGRRSSFQCANKSTQSTAIVPKIAPDAPSEGAPTSAKLPPRTLPKIPAAKYRMKNPALPICFSICADNESCAIRFSRIWTKPACKKIGVMNLNHWLGGSPWNPPNAQMSSNVHSCVGGLSVLFKQPSSIVDGTPVTGFMHGGNRAPKLINASSDGPSIGLTTG